MPETAATETLPAVAAHTNFQGRVWSGPTPQATIWKPTAEEKGCQLLEPEVPYCEQKCGGDSVCQPGNQCVKTPIALNVGTVKLSGLKLESGASELSIDPMPTKVYSLPGSAKLLYPPFAEGDPVRLEALGAELEGFVIESHGIAPLEVLSQDIVVQKDQPVSLSWKPPGNSDLSRVVINLDISHHGGQKGEIECEVPDIGQFSIPASLVTKLIDLGTAGYPTIQIRRRTVASATISVGRVELVISSGVELPVQIPGVESCVDESYVCSVPGQVCDTNLMMCVPAK